MKSDFGSAFLRAEDLIQHGVWSELNLTIKEAHLPDTLKIKDGKEWLDKEALSFVESDQYLVMGKLNWRLLRYATGIESKEEAVGQTLILYAARGDWFGETGVAALRIRIPKEGVRPNVKKNIMGTDITGQRFHKPVAPQAPPPVAPKRTATEQINDCQTGAELLELLRKWIKAAPVHTAPEKWLGIAADSMTKIDTSDYHEDALDSYIQEINNNAQLTIHEQTQGKS